MNINGLNGSGSITYPSGTSGTSRTVNVGYNNATGWFSGDITQGSGKTTNLAKFGTGNLTLSGTNTYTGVTQVNAGTLELASTGQIASASEIFTDAASTFQLNGGVHTLGIITGNGTTIVKNKAILTVASITQGSLILSDDGLAVGDSFVPIAAGGGSLSSTIVPEPSTWAMLMLAAMGLGIYRRRR